MSEAESATNEEVQNETDLDPSGYSADEIREAISDVNDAGRLKTALELEKANESRRAVEEAIKDRYEQVTGVEMRTGRFETRSLDDLHAGRTYQVMRDLHDEEKKGLRTSIEEDGIDESRPIVIDEEGNVLDGHSRYWLYYKDDEIEEVQVVVKSFETDAERKDYAYKRNISGRQLDGGEKRETARKYLLEDHVPPDVQQKEVAESLSVSESTISRARKELTEDDDVDKFKDVTLSVEEKRQITKDHIRANPDKSTREIADMAPTSHSSVAKFRKDMDEEYQSGGEQEGGESENQEGENGGEEDDSITSDEMDEVMGYVLSVNDNRGPILELADAEQATVISYMKQILDNLESDAGGLVMGKVSEVEKMQGAYVSDDYGWFVHQLNDEDTEEEEQDGEEEEKESQDEDEYTQAITRIGDEDVEERDI
jgi:hypothetical protein